MPPYCHDCFYFYLCKRVLQTTIISFCLLQTGSPLTCFWYYRFLLFLLFVNLIDEQYVWITLSLQLLPWPTPCSQIHGCFYIIVTYMCHIDTYRRDTDTDMAIYAHYIYSPSSSRFAHMYVRVYKIDCLGSNNLWDSSWGRVIFPPPVALPLGVEQYGISPVLVGVLTDTLVMLGFLGQPYC